MYKRVLRPFLFLFDPEWIHHAVFSLIKSVHRIPGMGFLVRVLYQVKDKRLEKTLFGLNFPNPVGLAAGFDKDAKLFKELNNFGFGFIEIGTVTPKPQPGNPKKRMFRLLEDYGLINRMGFNNEGLEAVVHRLKKNKDVLIGGNIGKNKATSNDDAVKDYLICFESLFPHVDYFVVNVSSPNTPNLRSLQEKEPLTYLLKTLKNLNLKKDKPKPILLKIAPDLSNKQLLDIIDIINSVKIDGVIATNTTLSREGLKSKNKNQIGGLSGKPITDRSTEIIRFLSENSNKSFAIIGVGGIHSPKDAIDKLDAGADLIQLYTGFIYEGPSIIKQINKVLVKRVSQNS